MVPAAHIAESSLDVPEIHSHRVRIKNRLFGTIVSRQLQPLCQHQIKYRVRMLDGETVNFISAAPSEESADVDIGQHVTLDVLPSDVMLSPPRWVSHLEDNRWPARVVLAAQQEFGSLVTVKILGRFWTLKSTQRIFWLNRPPCAWDRVTVHIPLDAISIRRRYPGHPHLRPRLLREMIGRDAVQKQSGPPRSFSI
jgi:hypothetical protein